MTPAELQSHFDRISEAPGAVALLRQFILDLAVRGKLVAQDPNDEPASQLLKRIGAEKLQLEQIRSPKLTASTERATTLNSHSTTPSGWVQTTLGELSLKITDGTHKTPTYVETGIPFVSVKDFSAGKLEFTRTRFISPKEHSELYKRCDPRRGDILIGRIGTLGKAVLVDDDRTFSLFVSVGLIRFSHKFIQPRFFCQLLNSPLIASEFDRIKVGGGTHTNKLNLGDLHGVMLPLPPLPEQHRIVAKVDELMALCDKLEAAQKERETRRDRVIASSLQRLNEPADDSETFREHARFHINHLPRLTTRPEHAQKLRQTILNLAVRGRLVPQNPNDEPASELLKRIHGEKLRSLKVGKGAEEGAPKAQGLELALFDLPPGWMWLKLLDIGVTQTGTTPSSSNPEYFGTFIPFVKPGDLTGVSITYSTDGISETGIEHSRLIPRDSVLMVCIGSSIGKVNVTDRDVCCNQQINSLTPYANDLTQFASFAMRADYFQRLVLANAGMGTLPIISKGKWEVLPVPLPPLPEQQRIAARVSELMDICHRLDASLKTVQAESGRLLEAVLHKALEITT